MSDDLPAIVHAPAPPALRAVHLVDGPRRGALIETRASRLRIECLTHDVRYAIYDLEQLADGMRYFTFRGWEDELDLAALPGGDRIVDTVARETPKAIAPPLESCPKCGAEDEHPAALRQGVVDGIGIVDVGWRCASCGHEWGFEVLVDART